MPTFHLRSFMILIGFCAVVLAGTTVMMRWVFLRAEGAIYARQETEHAFEAASFRRAARQAQADPDMLDRVAEFKRLARRHDEQARKCAQLREYYETHW